MHARPTPADRPAAVHPGGNQATDRGEGLLGIGCLRDTRSVLLRQPKGDVTVAFFHTQLRTSHRQGDVLHPVHLIRARRRKTRRGQDLLPEQLAGPLIEGPKRAVARGGDEEQAAFRDDATAVVFGTRHRDAFLRQFPELAQSALPNMLTGIQVDGRQRSPGRRDRGVSVLVQELIIPDELISYVGSLHIIPGTRFHLFGAQQEVHDGGLFTGRQLRESGHHAFATPDDGFDIGPIAPAFNIYQ